MQTPLVMLVDDEVAYVEAIAERLRNRQFKIVTAFSGAEGVAQLKSNQKLDVIVLDVKMPGMDGLETLKALKKICPLTEVIMLTGHVTMESAMALMKQGAFDYLIKPFDIEQLVSKMEAAAMKKWAHEEKIKNVLKKEMLS
ncbi:response regulator [Desulfococcaceae bacterium HSG7]|nr:response regulator [Desulfococcaceae bacterium HSG7]